MKNGEVVGIAIIDVLSPPVTVSLVNANTEIIYYASQVPVTASLLVTNVDDISGPTGDTGPTGPAESRTIIPFASYIPAVMTTVIGQTIGTVALLGFGSSVTGVGAPRGIITTTVIANESFSMPGNGILNSIAAFYSYSWSIGYFGTFIDGNIPIGNISNGIVGNINYLSAHKQDFY